MTECNHEFVENSTKTEKICKKCGLILPVEKEKTFEEIKESFNGGTRRLYD